MKLKRRILSGALALTMVAGSFFINSGKSSAEDPVPWVPSPADEAFAAAAPTDWAFTVNSVGLHNAILVKYPTIDNAPQDGYISKSEANSKSGFMALSGSSINGTAAGIEYFTDLQYLDIHSTNLCDTLEPFMSLDKLISLELYDNLLMTGGIPTDILNLSKLQNLTLTGTPLGGEIPSELGLLPDLSKISLNRTLLTGEIPSSIGNLSKLEYFAIANNQIEGSFPAGFATLEFLRTLDVTNTKVSGKIPSSFNNLTIFYYSGSSLEILALNQSDNKLVDLLNQDMIDSLEVEVNNMPLASIPSNSLRLSNLQALLDQRTDAETAVSDLFDGTNISTGITETEIAAAEALVSALPAPSDTVTNLQAKIDLARQMLEARDTVDALLTADGANRATGITQADIDAAQILVTALEEATAGDLKTELQAKIDLAQSLLDAEGLVGGLFTDATKTDLASGVAQGAIDAAQTAVTALPDGTTKTNLQTDIDLAKQMLDAKNHVDALLTVDGTNLASGVTQGTIDSAQTEVTALPDGPLKTDLQTKIDLAQSLLDAKTLADAKTAAKAELDQKAIDANNAIDALPNLTEDEKTAEKNKVNTDLNDAKTAIDAGTDTTAVNDAKNSGDTHITNDLNDAKALDTANLADAKTAAKAELVAKAESVKNAIDGLTSLSDAEKAAAKAEVEAELIRGSDAIDAATTITKVTEEKNTSLANMDKILKDAKVLDAKNAVGNLFDNTGKIKDNVNQDVINNAKVKVEGLDPGTEKDLLNALIAEAEKQLNAKTIVTPETQKPVASGVSTEVANRVNTGDDSNILFYGMGLLLAAVGLSLVVRRKMIKG